MSFFSGGLFHDNNIFLWIILLLCLCDDFDDIFHDIEDWLPWIILFLCLCNDY